MLKLILAGIMSLTFSNFALADQCTPSYQSCMNALASTPGNPKSCWKSYKSCIRSNKKECKKLAKQARRVAEDACKQAFRETLCGIKDKACKKRAKEALKACERDAKEEFKNDKDLCD